MPGTPEGGTAARVSSETQRLTLERANVPEESAQARHGPTLLWSWTPEIALLRRGLWPGPRVGIERCSRLGIWRLRRWFDSPEVLRIEADLRSGRREMLRSPGYRAPAAPLPSPGTRPGPGFER